MERPDMHSEHFDATLVLAARLADRGDYDDAITVMVPWSEWSLPPFQRAVLGYNLAQMFVRLARADEALLWFDWGIGHEREAGKTFVSEGKAVFLAEQGRPAEAIALWEALLDEGRLDAQARAKVEQNIATVKAR